MDGIFNINKPRGLTSHDVVAKMRKLLKQKRAGHAGTLDPSASGVLPICVGQATRVAEYLSQSGKAYQAEVIFGAATDTYDSEGTITASASTTDLTLARIEGILPHFLGPQMQAPPVFSAIKFQGQPAYKRARAGEEITLNPRPVDIYSLKVLDWIPPHLTLVIECSKGTYIRSLAHDLGMQLGCFAYLGALTRTRSGPFTLLESITLEQFADAIETNTAQHYLYPVDKALEQYPAITIDATTIERVMHGNAFDAPVTYSPGLARIYDSDGHFLAIAEWNGEQNAWHPKKVFNKSSA
jgi:tRNA pseudouridine55 synthase